MHAHLNSPHSVRKKVTTWRVTWGKKNGAQVVMHSMLMLVCRLHRARTHVQMGSETSPVFCDWFLWLQPYRADCSQVTGALKTV